MKDAQSLYAKDGVPIDAENEFSRRCGELCRTTFGNSRFVKIEDLAGKHHRGPRGFPSVNLPPGCYLSLEGDGSGMRPVVTDAAFGHATAGHDLLAMIIMDITRWGGLPLIVEDHLSLNTLREVDSEPFNTYLSMMQGLCQAANEQGVVIFNGETAQMTNCVGSDNFDSPTKFLWSGACVGMYLKKLLITGAALIPGQIVIALRENSFRGNGWSSVRKVFSEQFGERWWENPSAQEWIKKAAAPSVLYDYFLTTVNGWHQTGDTFDQLIKMHFIAHISGGGIDLKFADVLFSLGFSAELTDLWEPPEIMKKVVEWRGMSDEEAYKAFNGGQGALLVVDENDVDGFITLAQEFSIDAKVCGTITEELSPRVTIHSKFNGGKVIFTP